MNEAANEPAIGSDLGDLAATQQDRILDLLSDRRRGWRSWRTHPHPELRRVLGRIHHDLQRLRRTLDTGALETDSRRRRRLLHLLTFDPTSLSELAAWEISDALRLELVSVQDGDWIGSILLAELGRLDHSSEVAPPWSQFFPVAELQSLSAQFQGGAVDDATRNLVVSRLENLYEFRSEFGRLAAARQSLRSRYMVHWLPVIAGLVSLLIVASIFAAARPSTGWNVILTAGAGALGSVLSGVIQLRDLVRILDMRTLRTGLYVQPFVGAAAGLFLLLILQSRVVGLPGVSSASSAWAAYGAYSFVAGFSEPFFLGVVARVAGRTSGRGFKSQGSERE